MAVYVDPSRCYEGNVPFFKAKPSCRMYADTESELRDMAHRIGMRQCWFQSDLRLPHFDLTTERRSRAVRCGAIEHTHDQMAEFMKQHEPEPIMYHERIYTRDIVQFLSGCHDQTASTVQIADEFCVSSACANKGLERLLRVNRVAEIVPGVWHLE